MSGPCYYIQSLLLQWVDFPLCSCPAHVSQIQMRLTRVSSGLEGAKSIYREEIYYLSISDQSREACVLRLVSGGAFLH
jgi:hypothetical protein